MIFVFLCFSLILAILPEPAENHISNERIFGFDLKYLNFYLARTYDCPILHSAFERYTQLINKTRIKCPQMVRNEAILKENIMVSVHGTCESVPHENMDENYSIYVNSRGISIDSNRVWGVLRALETLSQLFCRSKDGELSIPEASIYDFPRFSHRGVLLDTSRHYLPMEVIMESLDGMAYNKFNVFHWHIVDDQSFPYQSHVHPKLSEKGAYTPRYVYSSNDVAKIVEYASKLGIRVIPEFDIPGHSKSWGLGYPELLSKCGKKIELLNPIEKGVYKFLEELFSELGEIFKDEYFHIGGDEVNFYCWVNDEEIIEYMKKNDITNPSVLESLFIKNVEEVLKHRTTVSWEELFSNQVPLRNGSIVQVWKGDGREVLSRVTLKGYKAILSAGFYLDNVNNGAWINRYLIEPTNFTGSEEQKELVIGGEACLWGEYIDDNNLISRFLPHASVVAERLWSPKNVRDVESAKNRINELKCRLNTRGLASVPINGPSFCDYY